MKCEVFWWKLIGTKKSKAINVPGYFLSIIEILYAYELNEVRT